MLGREVSQLFQLCSFELDASKQQLQKMRDEKFVLMDKLRSVKLLLEHVHASLAEEEKKTGLLENPQPTPTSLEGEGLAPPSTEARSEDGEANEKLREQRLQEKLWRTMVTQHEGQHKDLEDKVHTHERAVDDLQQRTIFLEHQSSALAHQMKSLKKKGSGLALFPHPLCYPSAPHAPLTDLLKVSDCEYCRCGFLHNDIVVASCRHLYHPWCAIVHFGSSARCFNATCNSLMSPDWFKSFGFREFDKEMEDQAVAEGCEDARLQALNLRTQAAKSHCPNVGEFWAFS